MRREKEPNQKRRKIQITKMTMMINTKLRHRRPKGIARRNKSHLRIRKKSKRKIKKRTKIIKITKITKTRITKQKIRRRKKSRRRMKRTRERIRKIDWFLINFFK